MSDDPARPATPIRRAMPVAGPGIEQSNPRFALDPTVPPPSEQVQPAPKRRQPRRELDIVMEVIEYLNALNPKNRRRVINVINRIFP